MDWNVHFVHFSCVQYFFLQQMVVVVKEWPGKERKGQQWELSCLLQKQPVQLLSELPGGNNDLCWKEPSPPYCNRVLEDEQRCWPWSNRKESVLVSSVECDNCFWGCSDVCCGKMTHYYLLPLPRIPSVQHRASGTADHLWDTACLFCWNVLPRCLAVCVVLSNEVNQSISSVLLPLLWPLPTVLVHRCERTCHAACVPVSAEVYMCFPPSLLKVYREKLDCPGQLRQPNSSSLCCLCQNVDWWMEHELWACVSRPAPALG